METVEGVIVKSEIVQGCSVHFPLILIATTYGNEDKAPQGPC